MKPSRNARAEATAKAVVDLVDFLDASQPRDPTTRTKLRKKVAEVMARHASPQNTAPPKAARGDDDEDEGGA